MRIRLPHNFLSLEGIGTWIIRGSVLLLCIIFAPVAYEEIRYAWLSTWHTVQQVIPQSAEKDQLSSSGSVQSLVTPIDPNFGIVIPKIGANSRVIADVDWRDSRVYQPALAQGVAQAAGSALPGQHGNVFLFAHAGADLLEALRYNAVFYLLDKLESGDEIDVWYQGQPWQYRVTEKKVVTSAAVEYVAAKIGQGERLTLMTCWPMGTTWKRLIVLAEPISP